MISRRRGGFDVLCSGFARVLAFAVLVFAALVFEMPVFVVFPPVEALVVLFFLPVCAIFITMPSYYTFLDIPLSNFKYQLTCSLAEQ